KLLVTSRALRLRRDHPELFTSYRPVLAEGAASAHVIAVDRGGVTAVATRLPAGLARDGGWTDTVLMRSEMPSVDVLTGRRFGSGPILLDELLQHYPVALLQDLR